MTNLRAINSSLEPAAVLELAKSVDLTQVVVFGWCEDESLYITGSEMEMAELWYLITAGKATVEDWIVGRTGVEDE